ncbi:MAG: hypothetical protein L0220_09400 [Acidobacteria bacterium]|nr:hypothetical protein [Acidobacteriota bacterium]
MKNDSNGRLLAPTCSYRPYQDNHDKVIKICEETGRKPAEVLRNALDEWLLMRHGAVNSSVASTRDIDVKIDELQRAVVRLAEQFEKLDQRIYLHEIISAVYRAINLISSDFPYIIDRKDGDRNR